MKLEYKKDFPIVQKRMEAWWEGEILDRIPVKVTAPLEDIKGCSGWILAAAFPLSMSGGSLFEDKEEENISLERYFTDPEIVIPRVEKLIEKTYWGGDSFPVMFPVPINMVAVLAVYLGSPIKFINTKTTWIGPSIADWKEREKLVFDPGNNYWEKSKVLVEEAGKRGRGKYLIGIPDLNGPGEILARLRGDANLCIDTIENPGEILSAMEEINDAWFKYWQELFSIIHKYEHGYINHFSIWSEKPMTDLQCDFSVFISPEDFKRFFLPFIEEQTQLVDRTIYHLDGPDSLKHLDPLLSLPGLDGFQWVPGAGSAPMSEWIELLQKIQDAGKKLLIICEKDEVEKIVRGLRPEGILIETSCGNIEEAEQLLKNVKKWM